MTDQLSAEEIRMPAEAERKMDSGVIPYVLLDGGRVMVSAEGMRHFGLEQGQTITQTIFLAILEFNIAHCEAMIEAKKHLH